MIAPLLSLLLTVGPGPQTVNLTVTSTSDEDAPIHIAVFRTAEDFQADQTDIGTIEPTQNGRLQTQVEVPATGEYVFAAYHDLNNNGKLDRNFFGIPTEPYGFSKQAPTKWRSPRFAEVAIRVSGTNTATIRLKRWNEY